ncbi:MAG TPA: hypothetical protein PLM32_15590, partial [Candidatus Competibacter sp.]|nr:hypothetical protein [Candidatus Competibacter sp.]
MRVQKNQNLIHQRAEFGALGRRALSFLNVTVILLVLPFTILAAPADNVAMPTTSVPDQAGARKTILVDDFTNLSGWTVSTSNGARLEVAQDTGHTGGRATRLGLPSPH